MRVISCANCGKTDRARDEQYWVLNDYYGYTGCFCSKCYDKVARDAYGEPKDPIGNLEIALSYPGYTPRRNDTYSHKDS